MKIGRIVFCLMVAFMLSSCAYLSSLSRQGQYAEIQETNPGLHNLKHMIGRETFFIYGLIQDATELFKDRSLSVAAYSDRFKHHELVDITHFARVGTHYSLNLPPGKYNLFVFSDNDQNEIFDQSEVIGQRQIELREDAATEKIITGFDISISTNIHIDWSINIPVLKAPEIQQALFYPQGSIRSLDDPIFDRSLSTLGLYEPAAFLERSPAMFYTLEEFLPYKVPVIFVHGIGGTVTEFTQIIDQLDRERYVPWFFYYPSGGDLNHLAENFYRLYLSGTLFPNTDMPMIIVAHSMGGLVVREALNLHQGQSNENKVALLITIASPFGGHPSTISGVKNAPLVLPAWRDLVPGGPFIQHLYRKPLLPSINYQLLYAYDNPDMIKLGANSDGVVPLSSQLYPAAQKESTMNMGFNSSHTGILKDDEAIRYITTSIHSVKGFYPESYVRIMRSGGYDVDLNEEYTNREKYVINVLGKYLAALSKGKLAAINSFQKNFIKVSQGNAPANHFVEKAWLKFVKDYPYIIDAQ